MRQSHLFLFMALLCPVSLWAKEPPRIVASIAPVYVLVSEVTKGVTEPELLVGRNASLHHYTLTPRNARALGQADIVFYIGEGLENFLHRPLENLSKSAWKIPLSQAKGITLLPAREHALWEEGKHHHGHYDMHIWLSPANARAMLTAIADTLSQYDPERKAAYIKNAAQAIERLNAFDTKIKKKLAPYKTTPFVVFHDAYQYFEQYYGLHSVGALMLSSEVPLGAATLDKLAKAVQEHNVACLFSEPHYDPARMQVIAGHTGSRVSVLDPLETGAVVTEDGYGSLLNALAETMVDCFDTI